jgi:replication initiator protein RepSA
VVALERLDDPRRPGAVERLCVTVMRTRASASREEAVDRLVWLVADGELEHALIEVARQAGDARTMTLDTYAHVMAELDGSDDPELGAAIDPRTYDYEGAVLWNWHAPGLWNRFIIELVRVLAGRAVLNEREWSKRPRGLREGRPSSKRAGWCTFMRSCAWMAPRTARPHPV